MIRAHRDDVTWTVYPSRSKGVRRAHLKFIFDSTMYILDADEARDLADRLHDVAEEIEK